MANAPKFRKYHLYTGVIYLGTRALVRRPDEVAPDPSQLQNDLWGVNLENLGGRRPVSGRRSRHGGGGSRTFLGYIDANGAAGELAGSDGARFST